MKISPWAYALPLAAVLIGCTRAEDTPAPEAQPAPLAEVLPAEAPAAQPSAAPAAEPAPEPEPAPESVAAPPAPPTLAFDDATLRRRIAELSDDAMEGRAPATPGGAKAEAWIVAELQAAGLAPGGVDGGWFQPVPLVKSRLDEAASSLTIGGGEVPLAFGTDVVFWSKREGDQLAFADSELVFVGYGAVAPEYGWNDYEGLDVTGKTVVILVNDPGFATGDPALFTGNAMTYYGRWVYKFEEAGRQGAAAAILVHEDAAASYPWAVVDGSWRGDQYDLVRPNGGADRTHLEGWITKGAAERLFAAAGLDYAEMKAAAATRGFRAVDMGSLTASGAIAQTRETLVSNNVVGVIEGAERPDDVVLLTAHWDHLGTKPIAGTDDQIHNGAVDNATGVAGVISIAEAIAKGPRPARTVMALLVTAEESGLLGSEYYALSPLRPLGQTVGGINIDGSLPIGRSRDMVVVGKGASELEDILATEAGRWGKTLSPDPSPQAGYFYRSDHISFAKRGVPMLYADGGADLVQGGLEAGRALEAAYRDNAYHLPSDEYDPGWNLEGLLEDYSILHDVARRLADGDTWPNWYDGNEFRALRDAQRAAPAAEPTPAPAPATPE